MDPETPKNPDAHRERDWALMKRLARGDETATSELLQAYQAALMNFFRRLGAQTDEAEDALQETFGRLFAYRHRYKPTGSFRTFLYTVARRAWIDLCRKRQRRQKGETTGDVSFYEAPVGTSSDDRMDLEAALRHLPETHRMVVILSVFGGLQYEEISKVLEIPEGTVKSRMFHALRKLKAQLIHASDRRS